MSTREDLQLEHEPPAETMTSGEGRDEHPLDLAHPISQQAQARAADSGVFDRTATSRMAE